VSQLCHAGFCVTALSESPVSKTNGLEHSDVRWRNIGENKDDADLWKIVIFDLVGVKDQASEDWAAGALENLRKSISE
jgi:hypothetical protein